MWARIGAIIVGIAAVLAFVVAVAQLLQSTRAANEQNMLQATLLAIEEEQLKIYREQAILQASGLISGPTTTAVARRAAELESTAAALATLQIGVESTLTMPASTLPTSRQPTTASKASSPTSIPTTSPMTKVVNTSKPAPTTRSNPPPPPTPVPPSPVPPTPVPPTTGILVIQPKYGDGSPIKDQSVGVYIQGKDANGNPIRGDEVNSQYVGDSGSVSFELQPGTYAVWFSASGYEWPEQYNHEVRGGQTTTVVMALGRITLVLRRADGSLIKDQGVGVYKQGKDANGQLLHEDGVDNRNIDATGMVTFDLTPGMYALRTDLVGYPWMDFQFNHEVKSGEVTKLSYTLGRLSVTSRRPDGSLVTEGWVSAYTQGRDANGNPIIGDWVMDLSASPSGIVDFDLTPGTYIIKSQGEDNSIYDLIVNAGQTVTLNLTVSE